MPNQPKTPLRNIRVPDDLWTAAKAKAESRGETVTDVLIRALRRYVARS
jgi:hypothetical protein